MNRSRLAGATVDALVVSLALGALLSPPDPVTPLLYAGPAFLLALPLAYRYGRRSARPWWQRYLVFVAGPLAAGFAWRVVSVAVGGRAATGGRTAFLLAGVAVGAWLAYFGGLERLRGVRSR